jgi:hypothetical protein
VLRQSAIDREVGQAFSRRARRVPGAPDEGLTYIRADLVEGAVKLKRVYRVRMSRERKGQREFDPLQKKNRVAAFVVI